jgi:hypothetical protein
MERKYSQYSSSNLAYKKDGALAVSSLDIGTFAFVSCKPQGRSLEGRSSDPCRVDWLYTDTYGLWGQPTRSSDPCRVDWLYTDTYGL